jgi:ferredoxin
MDGTGGPVPASVAGTGAAAGPDAAGPATTTAAGASDLGVWIDQDLCTGDGLCVQYAPDVFEFDIDGLAYVKDGEGRLQLAPGSRVDVPSHLRLDVIDAARECPGDCIHVNRRGDGRPVAGPEAPA